MRFFHISDLHIGKQLYHYSLKEAQSAILEQIVERVRQYRPDALLIAGDIFDKTVPSGEAYLLFDAFLDQLAAVEPKVPVLAIAGNHDSAERLQYAASFLEKQQIYIAAFPPRKEEERLRKITLQDPFGPVNFYLLPFTKPGYVRYLFPEGDAVSYDDGIRVLLEREAIDERERNVLLSHQFYVSGSQKPMVCGSEQGYLTHGGSRWTADGGKSAARMEEGSPAKEGMARMEEGSPAKEGMARMEERSPAKEGAVRMEEGPLAKEGMARMEEGPPAREDMARMEERPPAREGAVRMEEGPPARDGSGSEQEDALPGESRPVSVGGIDSVDVVHVRRFDYVALGHLHGAQWIGRPEVRYCGTPLKYSVSEEAHEKSITMVTLGEKGTEAKIETIPLAARQDVRTERGTLKEVIEHARQKDDDFVSIILTDEKELFHPRERLEEHYSHILEIRVDNSRTRARLKAETVGPAALEPLEAFKRFYQEMRGCPMSREEEEILQSVIQKAEEEEG